MTAVAKEWKEALNTYAPFTTLVGHVKAARETLRQMGEASGRTRQVEQIIYDADREGNPVEILRALIEGIEQLEQGDAR